jgi:hypothetical protein
MQDLTEYSDAELSLVVFNDEDLYRFVRRTYNLRTVRKYLEEMFETIEADRAEDDDAPEVN